MSALPVNAQAHRVARWHPPPDNASMHRKRRTTPLGLLMEGYNGGISDNELARQLKRRGTPVDQATITRIATGSTKNPDETTLGKIAEFFGVTTAMLRGRKPVQPETRSAAQVVRDLAPAAATPAGLTPEAIEVARIWMRLSPGRQDEFRERLFWTEFFERKHAFFRKGISREHLESHAKFERNVEASYEKQMRQRQLFEAKE